MIGKGARFVSQNGETIWKLGLIALAKLLSPSHNQTSITHHRQYLEFLRRNVEDDQLVEESKAVLKKGFKGFCANRFGRMDELSMIFCKHKQMLQLFLRSRLTSIRTHLSYLLMHLSKASGFLFAVKLLQSFIH